MEEVIPFGAPPVGAPTAPFDTTCDLVRLRREASRLHWAAFGREISDEVAKRYTEAHEAVLKRVDIAQSRWMQRVLEARVDLEALEIVLRSRQPDHVLCHKFKLLIYVAEAFPEYYTNFINEEPRRAAAFCSLALHCLRALYKYLKGWMLSRKFQ